MLRALTTSLLLLTTVCLHAQETAWALGVRGGYGYLIAHHDNLKRMVAGHIPSAEVFLERKLDHKGWHMRYGKPSWGIGFWAADLRADELGNGFRLTPYLSLPLAQDEHQALHLRFGWGIGYITRPFNREDNYKGQAIGSYVNVNMPLGLEYTRRIGRTVIGAGLCIEHQSNGAFKVPNLGVNIPSVQLVVKHDVGQLEERDTTVFVCGGIAINPDRLVAYATVGLKETFPVSSGKHSCLAVVIGYQFHSFRKVSWEAGLDYFRNGALEQRADRLGLEAPSAWGQLGIHGGPVLVLGRMSLLLHAGVYVANSFEDDGLIFNRLGLRHQLGRHWLVNFTLKTHLATADHFELGFGYRIR
ncbi:MAG: acyloxyacyl hydrolase [Flavobacteriales bacterium]|nr:MAG: acyloxyacyl hydrolase [Flavobacteriales bacterium]